MTSVMCYSTAACGLCGAAVDSGSSIARLSPLILTPTAGGRADIKLPGGGEAAAQWSGARLTGGADRAGLIENRERYSARQRSLAVI